MKFVLFKDVLEERSAPQYGIVGDGEKPDVTCLCCGGTVEYGDYEVIRIIQAGQICRMHGFILGT